ncbi:MAG: hypothetical protein K2Y37_12000 [Pirellulales bacterium]|nr:hypothetical protein [Pirellulales bacterium]
MTALVPAVSRDEALRRLARRGWRRLFARAPRDEHLELVYLPRYQIALVPSVNEGGLRQGAAAGLSSSGCVAFVGAYEGDVGIFDLAGLTYLAADPAERFAPRLSTDEALHFARQRVQRAALASTRPHERLTIVEPPRIELVYYPYWAYYFRRCAGMLDAALLDAVTGSRAGPQLTRALLAALATNQGIARASARDKSRG